METLAVSQKSSNQNGNRLRFERGTDNLALLGERFTCMTHEGRNVLQRIQASVDELSYFAEEREEETMLVNRVQRGVNELRQLFHETREFAGPMILDLGKTSLRSVVQAAWEQLEVERRNSGATLVIEGDVECFIDGDRLAQVFRNLLENSIAAEPDACVRVEIRCLSELTEIHLHDDGPGLDPEQQAHVFEPFFTTKRRGTGLGMAISQRIVEAHGGRMEVRENDPGAHFVVLLPTPTQSA